MKKIGITGVIGAGKSCAIQILKTCGYTILDCDRINDELLLPSQKGYRCLVETFGDGILGSDGRIDRVKMSNQIFSDPIKKERAEAILHPMIKQEINQRIQAHAQESIVFVEVPLLYETGWETSFDEVWVIASDEELIWKRLMEYRGINEAEARRRMHHQLPQEVKIQKADHVLWNNSDKESLKQQIYAILEIETKR